MKLENPDLESTVEDNTGLKQLIVNYIGSKLAVKEDVTVDMAVQVFAAEFPEFLMAIAEENFLRGYQQAFDDLDNPLRTPPGRHAADQEAAADLDDTTPE
tara:strand:+ start:259 stop:558 length:300 start_codon:yes stop_codon:yes gene_type:complete